VTFFNGIYELAKKNHCDYENIKSGFLLSGYINEKHTFVPGPDGKFGYGGKCFPKDTNIFARITEGTPLGDLVSSTVKSNDYYRGKE
jgi:UDPglucose 6-dehydrogenase